MHKSYIRWGAKHGIADKSLVVSVTDKTVSTRSANISHNTYAGNKGVGVAFVIQLNQLIVSCFLCAEDSK